MQNPEEHGACIETKGKLMWATLILFMGMMAGSDWARAAVIASCGPWTGYTFVYESELHDQSGWIADAIESTTIFTGTDSEEVSDVIIERKGLDGNNLTQRASDYGHVIEVHKAGPIRHVIVLWGPVTELYHVNTEAKKASLLTTKSGPIELTHAYSGECE